ncbi:MAG: response regulator [Neomegalonema sp.]|nr:response regulator [Neomegalonema sp.]
MSRIFVIEDEMELREMIAEELEDEGHDVSTASNGQDALDKVRIVHPDVILADINMPKMNGFQLKRQIAQSGETWAKVPFVFVSAFADKSDIADGMMVGADHYVTKPIDFPALHAWLRSNVHA